MCFGSVVVLEIISIFIMSACAGHRQPQVLPPTVPNLSEYSATLRRNIHRANASEYLPVGALWKNPTIVIQLETTSIILADGTRKETSPFDLAKDLATLPKSAWPLGRVVILSRSGRTFPIIPLQGVPTPNIDPDPRLSEADSRAASVAYVLEILGLEVVAGPVG
jgi:hypothetical protein